MSSVETQNDPMMEIFLEECGDLVSQYETYLSMAADRGEYTMDIINELFRITHTIKADATMMLFECVAVPMRAFERILYFYRDEKGNVNFAEFTDMLERLVDFCKNEIELIVEGKAKETDGDAYCREYNEYRDKLAAQLTVENVENVEKTVKAESHNEPMRFYIGAATEAEPEKTSKPRILDEYLASKEAEAEEIENQKQKSVRLEAEYEANVDFDIPPKPEYKWMKQKKNITNDDLQRLYDTVQGLYSLEGKIMERFGQDYGHFADLLSEFHEINISLINWITNAATVPMGHITPKLKKTIDEMNRRLGHNVSISITGEDILVEKEWLEKLSGALVHMLRNAVDHGIESKEYRIKAGKPAEGSVFVDYQLTNGLFIMKVSDDGRGIDTEKLKNTAIERGLIFDDDMLSEQEIYKLIFLPGVTTNDTEGVYSGRGVGMDVVQHNIEGLGGSVEIESTPGVGTSFTVTIPMTNITGGEESVEDEDFDSRR